MACGPEGDRRDSSARATSGPCAARWRRPALTGAPLAASQLATALIRNGTNLKTGPYSPLKDDRRMRIPGVGRSVRSRTLAKAVLAACMAAVVGAAGLAAYVSWVVRDLFRLNRACQEEGYYMAEFEFKMLGFAYLLDRGRYLEALSGIRRLHQQLKSRKGLVKVPAFTDKRQELEFYLSLQNPRTGAFMDDSFPFCTYDGPTGNVLLHVEALARQTGQPLRLKYPLRYLDAINTPPKLVAYLEDVSRVGWIAARFPTTPFHFARDLLDYATDDNVLERNRLYAFSREWKRALLEWFHDFQDPETGYWGPKCRRSGRLAVLDPHNCTSVVKAFVDREGNDLHPGLGLRYRPQMFATTLKIMSRPMPADEDLHRWHQWTLTMARGTSLLLRYLWKDVSAEQRAAARRILESYVRVRADKCFIPEEGAFSHYPGSRRANLDGTSTAIGLYFDLGAYSADLQRRLWGDYETTCTVLGDRTVTALTAGDLAPLTSRREVNSVRLYAGIPGAADLTDGAVAVHYPRSTPVLDAVDLALRVRRWLETTPQSMGNWVSRQELLDRLDALHVRPVPVWTGELPLAEVNSLLREKGQLTLVGFDTLQAPRCRITLSAKPSRSRRFSGKPEALLLQAARAEGAAGRLGSESMRFSGTTFGL